MKRIMIGNIDQVAQPQLINLPEAYVIEDDQRLTYTVP